ncbi:MAG TPA: M6 family metalloprotease domain-containing protein [Prolixibacteraceae bacterium]|nr:M6 family metalloprotease domain-containing protein [Prolixibacteraceae bacterium]
MRKRILFLFIFLLLIFINQTAFGIPAYPFPVAVIQPDGTKIVIIQKGDEHVKWAQTIDGYSVMRNKSGIFEYATLSLANDMIPSGIPAKNQLERSSLDVQFLGNIRKGLVYSKSQVNRLKSISDLYLKSAQKAFPTSGSRKLICILIGFTDKAFTKTKADFENLFNQVGYVTDGATGSVFDYYKENSYGQLNLSVTVAGPYVAAHNMAYYGANNASGDDTNPGALVTEAVTLANPSVNYADFDNDGDGSVDGICVIYAGYGEENTGVTPDAIWAHSSAINPLTLDGKIVSRYSASPELRGNSGTGITRIGVICHEFGHVMGAADYYDTDYEENGSYDGTGTWDIMGGGAWNNNGVTPAHHNPYTKIYTYGWAAITTLASGVNTTLNNAAQYSNSFYRINTATSNEYFLIENRQKLKFDSYIPGHGMIIYHVDDNYISTAANGINTGSHQGMYPVCANATGLPPAVYGNIDSGGLPFPGTANKTSFTDITIPNMQSWSGVNTGMPITNITENVINRTVSFTAPIIPDPPSAFVANPATSIGQTNFSANWNAAATANGYRLDVATNIGFTSFVVEYSDKDIGNITNFKVTGLSARTQYYYRLRAYNYGGLSSNSNIVQTITLSSAPAAPVELSAVSCNNLMTIKWRKNSGQYVSRYRIYAGITSNPTVKMDSTTSISDTLKIISGLIPGQNYYFRVTAVNDDGPESVYSSQSTEIVKTGVIPVIKAKWGDVLICSNLGDSIANYQWYKGGTTIVTATWQYYATDKQTGTYSVETIDRNGCKNPSNTISISGTKSLVLYPNPASVNFSLKLDTSGEGSAIISIINSSGIKVMELQAEYANFELTKQIPVSNLDAGIYVVQVVLNRKDLYTTKLVVKK